MTIYKKSAFSTYLRLLKSVKPYTYAAILAFLGIVLYAVTDYVLYKHLLKHLIDDGFVDRKQGFLLFAPLLIVGLFLFRGLASFLNVYFMGVVGRSVVRDFRQKLLLKLMKVPVRFFDETNSGSLLSKINYDTEQVASAITDAVSGFIRGVFTTIAILLVMFTINWLVTLIVFVVGPLLGIYLKHISNKMRKYSTQVQDTMGNVTHVAEEVIEGHKEIMIFDGYLSESNRVSSVVGLNRNKEMKVIRLQAISVPIMQLMGAIALAFVVYLCTLNLFGANMTAGEFSSYFGAMLGLLRPIKQIAAVNSTMQRGIAGAMSIFSLMDAKEEKDDGVIELQNVSGEIEFQNVSFSYKDDSKTCNEVKGSNYNNEVSFNDEFSSVINDISFKVNPGETVALVGRSGSGKSTLVSLLTRFYNIENGQILIDGTDINKISLKSLRDNISIVTQHVTLFNGTIAENIAYGTLSSKTAEEIEAAAKMAHAFEFISKLPEAMNTMIGDNGMLLSGGQRQRIAIARAILKDSPILILDEATSALDSQSEKYIQHALENLMSNRTTLIVAHRLSTVEKADKIIVLEDGKIIEQGSHKELINQNGHYSSLQRSDFFEEKIIEAKKETNNDIDKDIAKG